MDEHDQHPHRRGTDDIILELLRIVSDIQAQLTAHINDEIIRFKPSSQRTEAMLKSIIENGFVEGNLPQHKEEHEHGYWLVRLKRWLRKSIQD